MEEKKPTPILHPVLRGEESEPVPLRICETCSSMNKCNDSERGGLGKAGKCISYRLAITNSRARFLSG